MKFKKVQAISNVNSEVEFVITDVLGEREDTWLPEPMFDWFYFPETMTDKDAVMKLVMYRADTYSKEIDRLEAADYVNSLALDTFLESIGE